MNFNDLQKVISCYNILTRKIYEEYKNNIDELYIDVFDFREKLYLVKNGIETPPKCLCGNNLKYKNMTKGYLKTCGNISCINAYREYTIMEKYGVKNPSQNNLIKEKVKETNLKKYGVENPFQSEKIKEKIKKTNLEKYGFKSPLQNKQIKEKAEKTNLEKYGNESPSKTEKIKEKAEKTNLEKYGFKSPTQNSLVKEKIKKTNFDKYGVENPFQSEKIKEKIKKTNLEKYGVEYNFQSEQIKDKIKNTNLEKYGVKNPSQNNLIKEKVKETNLKKYGSEYPFQSEEIKEKIDKTNLKKYGTISPIKSDIIRKKIILKNKNIIENSLYYENKKLLTYNKDLIEIECLICNNVYKISRSYFNIIRNKNINSCRVCNPILVGRSNQEIEIYEFCKNEFPNLDIIPNHTIDKYEIDIYFSELNFGIEFNGLYWHSEIRKEKNYHQKKVESFEEKYINILHVWEDDWNYKTDIIKNIIRSKINPNKIYGRKCSIKEITSNESKNFHNNYHLDGYSSSKIHIGIYYNNELISVCSFGKSRFNKKYEYELSRYTTKENYSIIGGFSKMLKYFEKKYKPQSIISYKKLDLGYKNFYEQVGFIKEKRLKPNYYWVVDGIRENRIKYQRHKLENILPGQTECEYMYEKGYFRCFDSGCDVFIKVNNIELYKA